MPPADRTAVVADARLTELVYELLDAHADTAALLERRWGPEVSWEAHLDYLRDLQRVGRELLARVG